MGVRPEPLYRAMAGLVQARLNCLQSNNTEWRAKHEDGIDQLLNFLPSGSGIDNGVKIDLDESTGEKLVFHFGFHHMNEGGMYDGWTEHTLTVRGSLQFGFRATISGRNRNDIKDYLHELFSSALCDQVKQHETEPGEWEWLCERYAETPWVL